MALTKRGVPCLAYHAGLKDSDRSQVQEDWMDGKVAGSFYDKIFLMNLLLTPFLLRETFQVAVITATISFGMGVDKATVRFVAHWHVPQSVAAYYQVYLTLSLSSVRCVLLHLRSPVEQAGMENSLGRGFTTVLRRETPRHSSSTWR